jgi:amidase
MLGDNMSGMTVELVVSKSVRDTAAVLEAVHGPAPGDPYVAPAPERPYTDEVGADPGKLRVGLMVDPPIAELESHPECAAAARNTATLLESLGHSVEESSPADPQIAEQLDLADTFLTRWAAGQAATLDQLAMLVGREVGPEDVEPLTWALAEIGRERTSGRYLRDVALHHTVTRVVAGWYESGFDLLLTPTMALPPVPLGTHDDSGDDPMDAYRSSEPQGGFTALFNVTGQPAISLPLHWTEDGLPIGVHLIAAYGREDLLIRIAAQLEQARPWADRRPGMFAGAETPSVA